MRRVENPALFNTSDFGEKELEMWQRNPKLLEKYQS